MTSLSNGQRTLVNLHFIVGIIKRDDRRDGYESDVLLFLEFFPQLQSLTYTRCKVHFRKELLLLSVDCFLEIAAARICSNATLCLTVFLNPEEFMKSMEIIPTEILEGEMDNVRLVKDENLSYITQLD